MRSSVFSLPCQQLIGLLRLCQIVLLAFLACAFLQILSHTANHRPLWEHIHSFCQNEAGLVVERRFMAVLYVILRRACGWLTETFAHLLSGWILRPSLGSGAGATGVAGSHGICLDLGFVKKQTTSNAVLYKEERNFVLYPLRFSAWNLQIKLTKTRWTRKKPKSDLGMGVHKEIWSKDVVRIWDFHNTVVWQKRGSLGFLWG